MGLRRAILDTFTFWTGTADPSGTDSGRQGDLQVDQTNIALYMNVDGATDWVGLTWGSFDVSLAQLFNPTVQADPGNGVAIPVTQSAHFDLTIGAGAETNTLAIPTFLGQIITISAGVVGGGTRAITVASAINVAGNTSITFNAVDQSIQLRSMSINGALAWRVVENDGPVLA